MVTRWKLGWNPGRVEGCPGEWVSSQGLSVPDAGSVALDVPAAQRLTVHSPNPLTGRGRAESGMLSEWSSYRRV